jgi:hypothetical protein
MKPIKPMFNLDLGMVELVPALLKVNDCHLRLSFMKDWSYQFSFVSFSNCTSACCLHAVWFQLFGFNCLVSIVSCDP